MLRGLNSPELVRLLDDLGISITEAFGKMGKFFVPKLLMQNWFVNLLRLLESDTASSLSSVKSSNLPLQLSDRPRLSARI